jgi:hypothetical protein
MGSLEQEREGTNMIVGVTSFICAGFGGAVGVMGMVDVVVAVIVETEYVVAIVEEPLVSVCTIGQIDVVV